MDDGVWLGRHQDRACVLMLMDCDNFKNVNDVFGHAEGDRVLVCLSRTIQASVREGSDHPFRFGGDEFGVLLTGLETEAAARVAERIRSEFLIHNHKDCSLSIGLAAGSLRGVSWEDLYHQADQALYEAKRRGGNRVVTRDSPSSDPERA
jgi:diguanylate cyclase (GGDEF)-like protein